jgi:hypothetical protein
MQPMYSRGRFGSLALPFAGATRPCAGRACTSRRVPLAGLRCAVSPGLRPRLFGPVSRPVCGFGVLVRLRIALYSHVFFTESEDIPRTMAWCIQVRLVLVACLRS